MILRKKTQCASSQRNYRSQGLSDLQRPYPHGELHYNICTCQAMPRSKALSHVLSPSMHFCLVDMDLRGREEGGFQSWPQISCMSKSGRELSDFAGHAGRESPKGRGILGVSLFSGRHATSPNFTMIVTLYRQILKIITNMVGPILNMNIGLCSTILSLW